MLDFENDPEGAWKLVGDRIKGEFIANFADIQARTGLTSTELATFAMQVLMDRVRQGDGLEAYILFAEHAADVLADSAAGIRGILEDDFRRHQAN
ncbi:hypothetical protein JQV19_06215 [Sulfitobacter mediterraneus]|uniref:hypothetical protein n=1 Tax=Sulfitobacter mediterraneus TaxID=83219 RepID=UPI00193A279F|nr:hypothetical protein [Sulfitobacter mediterraneus]MBM1556243.1 hypothetical protein [Sulfitobacter mediterraneus]MBM1567719.1 hypothetical protein [Sulfitobacter mediterraneus]MBM1571597.1 hypothetical protein [Sulfitobacter mediterraneus]MBM1575385.1 hypothetical protein [Sulfitobacter mediterraneus]MBM1579124.1 hypothetical protein [Sulfitobacter mediterraneus]